MTETEKTPKYDQDFEEIFESELNQLLSKDWAIELKNAGFEGDLDRGVSIMKSIAGGTTDVLKALKKRNQLPVNFLFPQFTILKTDIDISFRPTIEYKKIPPKIVASEIEINVDDISEMSNFGEGMLLESKAESEIDGLAVKLGSANDLAYLSGVEEGAHSAFIQRNLPKFENLKSPIYTLIAEYDSQDHEYHGLGWMIRMIKDAQEMKKLNPKQAKIILEPLESRLQKAIAFRKSQRIN